MADKKITALTATTTIVDADVFPVVTDTTGTPTTKKVTAANLGGYVSSLANTFTTNQIITGSSASAMLRVTQTGAGHALLVEDSANPDASPFIIDANGNQLLGATALRSVASGFQTAVAGQIFNEQGSGGLTAYTSVLNRADSNALLFILGKSRGTAAGDVTALINNDNIAQIMFAGADGTTLNPVAAQIMVSVDGTVSTGIVPGRLLFSTASSAGTLTERMRIDSAGQIGIGSATAAGYGIVAAKNITGGVNSYGMVIQGAIQSDVTSNSNTFTSAVSTAAAAFTLGTLTHFSANGITTPGAGSTITTQRGFAAAAAMTGATNNYGFQGLLASGTGRWNLYMGGTADNYLAGRLGVGATNTSGQMVSIVNTTAGDFALLVKGAAAQSANLLSIQNSAGTQVARIDSVGAIFDLGSNLNTDTVAIQLGNARTGNGSSFIDLIGDATYTDYGLRLIRNSGVNAISTLDHRGTGALNFNAQEAAAITFGTSNTERMRVDSVGNLLVGMTTIATSSAKTIHLANATVPTANPTGGGVLYVESGALKYRGSSGTVTTLGAA